MNSHTQNETTLDSLKEQLASLSEWVDEHKRQEKAKAAHQAWCQKQLAFLAAWKAKAMRQAMRQAWWAAAGAVSHLG
jgi:hypothetical protein